MVGPTKFPFSYPETFIPLPSKISFASFPPYSINFSTLYLDSFVMSGAMSGLVDPGPTDNFLDLSKISGTHFCESPTKTAVDMAIHLYPVDP